jgi:hypothetical protein
MAMKKIRTFNCKNCGTFERLISDDVRLLECKCGGVANRSISAARYFSNTTGRSPSAKS